MLPTYIARMLENLSDCNALLPFLRLLIQEHIFF